MTVAAQPTPKAPFPAFGGKSAVVGPVWARLGNPRNYIEPFAFTAAMLLKRPGGAGPIETINDLNSYVSNFWRAVQRDPEAVAAHADWPVVEDDLHARHRWLVTSAEARHKLEKVRSDPDFYDARIAGWWCWGACCWIGSGWCDETSRNSRLEIRPDIGDPRGINVGIGLASIHMGELLTQKLPHMDAAGRLIITPPDGVDDALGDARAKRPQLCNGNTTAGQGVLGHVGDAHRPQLADAFARGRGVNGNDSASTIQRRREWLTAWMFRLADRMRPVRVCCGHWARVCDSESTLTRLGTTGVFLDPPYRKKLADGTENRAAHIYANDKHQDVDALCDEVQAWCLKWGDNPEIRIALCGLEGEYPEVERAGWTKWAWKSRGGYGNRTKKGKENAARERIWFSPHCLKPAPESHLFSAHPSFAPAGAASHSANAGVRGEGEGFTHHVTQAGVGFDGANQTDVKGDKHE